MLSKILELVATKPLTPVCPVTGGDMAETPIAVAPVCGLLDLRGFSPHGQSGQGYPTSRDWSLPEYPCKATKCVANISGKCVSPASCVIGDDGLCEGYKDRDGKK